MAITPFQAGQAYLGVSQIQASPLSLLDKGGANNPQENGRVKRSKTVSSLSDSIINSETASQNHYYIEVGDQRVFRELKVIDYSNRDGDRVHVSKEKIFLFENYSRFQSKVHTRQTNFL